MKKKRLPILIIIPHGGYNIPEELSGYEAVDKFDLFMNSDPCANEIFDFHDSVSLCLTTSESRLFVDLDRSYLELPPTSNRGVIKKETLHLKKTFRENHFPDDIAIANILKRYYFPFHETIEKTIMQGEIKLILECHSIFPIGPEAAPDSWMPRPLILLENMVHAGGKRINTCSGLMIEELAECLNRSFAGEKETVTDRIRMNDPLLSGFILKKYGNGIIPMIRLSISRSLYLNEKYFSHDFLKVDEYRIRHLQGITWEAIEKFYWKIFK